MFGALLAIPEGRRMLRDARVWMALTVGIVAWLPLLAWNLGNEDAGVRFQLVERHPWSFHATGLWFLVIQPLLVTPLLFLVMWRVGVAGFRPGHGEVYTRLASSGVLDALLERGYRYLTIANGDNLGAAPDPRLAGWFAATDAPYAAEVCLRTANDRKGGHLAVRRSDGQLILRDTAQTPADQMHYFTDEHRHRYFHCNNLWLDLQRLHDRLSQSGPVLGLPLIRNEKTVDPTDPTSPRTLQLETAMGAAIEVFPGARAIVVERGRFLPVKTTNELMLLRSDVFTLAEDARLVTDLPKLPGIDLDPRHYKTINQFDERVQIVPSLRDARSLRVRGDWTFSHPVHVTGDATLEDNGQQQSVPPDLH